MNKKLWIVPAFIVVAGAGLSYWLPGQYVERGFQQLDGKSASSLYVASLSKPKAGEFDVELEPKDPELPSLVVKNNVKKSLWQATVNHEVFLDKKALDRVSPDKRAWLQEHAVDKPFLTGSTTIDALGAYHTQFASIEVNDAIADLKLELKPITGDITGHGSGALEYNIDWPGLKASSSELFDSDVSLLPVHLHGKGKLSKGTFVGENSIKGEGLDGRVEGTEPQLIKLGPYDGSYNVTEKDKHLQLASNFHFDQLTMEDNVSEPLTVEDFAVAFNLSGLDADNMQRLQAELDKIAESGEPTEALITEANQLLRNGFTIELKDWQAQFNGLPSTLDANLVLTENEIADLQNPMSFIGLLGNLSANLNLTIAADTSEIPQLTDSVTRLIMSGAVVDEGDQYSMEFSLVDGMPTLNGELLSIPGF